MTRPLPELTEALLSAARRAGAMAADAIAVEGRSVSVELRAGRLEQAERAESVEIGLRVLMAGGRQACVAASDLSGATIAAMADRAVAMAREAPEDPHAGLAEPGTTARDTDAAALELCDPAEAPGPAALEHLARRAEGAAHHAGGIAQVEASAGHQARRMHLAASNGFAGGYARSSVSVSAVAFVGEGTAMERDWAGEGRVHLADLPAAEGIGHLAAERARARLGARKPPTGAFPVLYDERVAASLVGHLLSAVNGATVARGSGWLRDRLGQPVLPPGLSLVEDPRRPRTSASRMFDAEGLQTQPRTIVQDGVLTGWVLDLATGRRLGMQSTANAARGPSAPPAPATSNIDLTPGRASRDDLVAAMGTGLIVTALLGASVNPTTGDYSRGASGFWVEGGQIAYPVNECTIAGNLREMLLRLTPADDARAHLATRVPSCLVEGLTIAGV